VDSFFLSFLFGDWFRELPFTAINEKRTLRCSSELKFFRKNFCVPKVSVSDRLPRDVMDEPSVSPHRVTELLAQWSHGDDAALTELTPLVYEELRRLAHHHMGGQRPDHTLQTTALVNEAYLRLADQTNPSWQNRAHFFAVAARAMRQILVSYARSQRAQKRGGGALKIELDEVALISTEESQEIVDLHEALQRLATLDSRKAQVVELKYFGGLNYDEMAEVLKISRVTVRRDWEFAKVWLYTELHDTA
jgi:RNA polymerase sigma factor (TIGR02999 family)